MRGQVVIFALLAASLVKSANPIPLPDFSFLRRGFRWLQGNSGMTSDSQQSQIIESVVNYSSSVIDIANVGNMLQLPLDINSLVVQGLTQPTLKLIDYNSTKRTNLLELAKNMNLTILLQKIKESGMDDVLDHEGPFTWFAPTNEAFRRAPKYCNNVALKDLMRYHVGKGSVPSAQFKDNLILNSLLTRRGVRINLNPDTSITTANGRAIKLVDNIASNGVLHVLDTVMCALYEGSAIFQVNRCGAMSTLSKLVNSSGLYSMLDAPSPLTLFAPTNDAFDKLPPEVMDYLLKNITALKEVLLFHVVPDVWYSAGLTDHKQLKTVQGQTVTIRISGGKVAVNNAAVTLADATVKNGAVHSIDTVLMPKHFKWTLRTLSPSIVLV